MQTEIIENHQAQLTIEIPEDQLETAKKKAARRISQEVRIKGFRKGKAPYRLVAKYVGEAAILEEAVESLSDDLYKKALEESEVLAYGPGALEDFKLEPAPTLVFTVPLQPEVELNNYQDVRVDFEEPEVSEEDVDLRLWQTRLSALEVLDDSCEVAELGNRVSLSVDSEFLDGDVPDDDEAEPGVDDEDRADNNKDTDGESDDVAWNEDDDKPYAPLMHDTFVHDEKAVVILDPKEDPFIDGFVEAIVGAELGAIIEFELTIPDDDPDKTIANRRVGFVVKINQIESVSIPELDDAFAETVSKKIGDEVMDLASLRASARKDLERAALEEANQEYSVQVLGQIIADAEIHYPELMLEHQVDELIEDFENELKSRKLTLKDYFRYTGNTIESLKLKYKQLATDSLEQRLVVSEFVSEEELDVNDEQVDQRLELVLANLGGSPEIRTLFNTPKYRLNIYNELLVEQITQRLCAIGRGEDPDKAVETYFEQLSDDLQTAQARQKNLRDSQESENPIDSDTPAWDKLRAEYLEREQATSLIHVAEATTSDAAGDSVGEADMIDNSDDKQNDDDI